MVEVGKMPQNECAFSLSNYYVYISLSISALEIEDGAETMTQKEKRKKRRKSLSPYSQLYSQGKYDDAVPDIVISPQPEVLESQQLQQPALQSKPASQPHIAQLLSKRFWRLQQQAKLYHPANSALLAHQNGT